MSKKDLEDLSDEDLLTLHKIIEEFNNYLEKELIDNDKSV